MICYPNAKINIGLRVLSKRKDGFHNISSYFLPIPLYDVLEFKIGSTGLKKNKITYSGIQFLDTENDLVMKAYDLLNKKFNLPALNIHLHKNIPIGAGLAGGSSDATFMLMMLNKFFDLQLNMNSLLEYAKILGSDCPFFLFNRFSLVSELGNVIKSMPNPFKNYHLVIIKPNFHCSTREVFSKYKSRKKTSPYFKFNYNSDAWKKEFVNDLESVTFSMHYKLKEIKQYLYSLGATYSGMSGSGSSIYGLFLKPPKINEKFDFWCSEGVIGTQQFKSLF